MTEYVVKKHKGRSGRSVFEWRVFAINKSGGNNCRTITTQLAKFRSEDSAVEFQARLIARGN